MKTKLHISLFVFFYFAANVSFAQQVLPLNSVYNQTAEAKINLLDSVYYHSASKPYIQGFIPTDYSQYWTPISPEFKKRNYFYRKLFKQSLVEIDSANYHITIDPVLNVSKGQDINTDSSYYTNTRGVLVKAEIGKHFALTTMFAECQSVFPVYLNQYVKGSLVGSNKPVSKLSSFKGCGANFG